MASTVESFRSQARFFELSGILLTHPTKGAAVMLDVDGNDIEMSPERVAENVGLRIGASMTVEWWLSPDIDLTCTYEFHPLGREVQTFYLDGLTTEEKGTVSSVVGRLFSSNAESSIALVVDYRGLTVEFDWDDFALRGLGNLRAIPDLLITAKRDELIDSVRRHGGLALDLGNGFVQLSGIPGDQTGVTGLA
ncbi:hypothetical protein ACQP08_05875 [Micromonospora zamorensis]|uniref:hypothetical protein n=1 Tax=Micromonospora zamorensis TaxID=709883 RepID=UPI003D8C4698